MYGLRGASCCCVKGPGARAAGLSHSRPRVPALRAAFTLLELMVVVGILLMLMALLMPALRGSMARAREVQCLNQLRQLGVLIITYAKDHKGELPPAVAVNPSTLLISTGQALTTYMNSLTMPSNVWYCPSLTPGVWSTTVYNEPAVSPNFWLRPLGAPYASTEFRIGYFYVGGLTSSSSEKFRKTFTATRFYGARQEVAFDFCASWEVQPQKAADVPRDRWNDFPHFGPFDPRNQNRLLLDGSIERRPLGELTLGYVYHHPRRVYW